MKPDSDAMRLLIERLLGDGEAWFKAEELDAVLSWLSGSERHGGDALATKIGPASEQTGRRVAVYDRLSAQLFRDGQLELAGAHVDIDVDDEIRRGRYRRLMTAFHPDRFPQHADWLTSRSQAVLASYARFRKGEAPEIRSPDEPRAQRRSRRATGGGRPQRPEWPRERRSARLTPMRGPGPLTQLRTWLLGIENLQQRILVVLAVVCLIPVIYAYVAYKPYREISSSEPAVVEQDAARDARTEPAGEGPSLEIVAQTAAPEPAWVMQLAEADARETAEPAEESEPIAEANREVTADTDPVLAWSEPGEAAPILPSWHEARQAPRPVDTEDGEPEAERADDLVATQPAPAVADSTPEATSERQSGVGDSAASDWMDQLADSAGDTLAAFSTLMAEAGEYEPPESPAEDPGENADRADESDPPSAELQVAQALAESRPPADALTERSVDNTTPPATEPPPPSEAAAEQPADESRLAASTDDEQAANPDAEPAEPETPAPAERPEPAIIADTRASEPESDGPPAGVGDPAGSAPASEPAVVADAQTNQASDERPRAHIEELLAGYRTSFENGWLDEFLDHFTADPRENAHRGLGWFRSNYGWLFDNTDERRLSIDILDISRGDDHWVALARFEMQVDYPDRPDTRSTRQVRYTIEANEHDQLRIAAIEY